MHPPGVQGPLFVGDMPSGKDNFGKLISDPISQTDLSAWLNEPRASQRSSSGTLTMLTAMRGASSRVSKSAAASPRLLLDINVRSLARCAPKLRRYFY